MVVRDDGRRASTPNEMTLSAGATKPGEQQGNMTKVPNQIQTKVEASWSCAHGGIKIESVSPVPLPKPMAPLVPSRQAGLRVHPFTPIPERIIKVTTHRFLLSHTALRGMLILFATERMSFSTSR